MDPQPSRYSIFVKEVACNDYRPGEEFEIETLACLRYLPDRRTVWKASCRGHNILLKVFDPHLKQKRDEGREWENSTKLHAAGLSIPAPLFRAKLGDGLLAVAYDFIGDGRTLDKVLADSDESTWAECFRQLLTIHAQQHAIGSYQSDDHLGNYLWSRNRLYMLDAGSYVLKSDPLDLKQRVQNMALLTANISLPMRTLFDDMFSIYLDLCPGDIDRGAFMQAMESAVRKAIEKRLSDYLRKTRRSSSKLEQVNYPEKSWHACREIDTGIKMKLLENPEHFLNGELYRGKRMGNGYRNRDGYSECDISEGGKAYTLRRFDKPTLAYRLSHFFSFPKALECWSNGHALRMFGVASPRPMACLLLKKKGMQSFAYLLLEKIPGERLSTLDDVDMTEIRAYLEMLGASDSGILASDFTVDENGVITLADTASIHFSAA